MTFGYGSTGKKINRDSEKQIIFFLRYPTQMITVHYWFLPSIYVVRPVRPMQF